MGSLSSLWPGARTLLIETSRSESDVPLDQFHDEIAVKLGKAHQEDFSLVELENLRNVEKPAKEADWNN